MDMLERTAIVLRLAREMRDHGNWCGETHIQKAVYFLQDLAGSGTGFDYVLYKHGPFSFDLRDHLTGMRANELLELQVQPQPYGPKLAPTALASRMEEKFPRTLTENAGRIDFVAGVVGDKGVSDLERLATALFITRREMPGAPIADRAARLNEVKPHVSVATAEAAVEEIDRLILHARETGLNN
jgi:hypothetical protein